MGEKTVEYARLAAAAVADKKAKDIVMLDIRGLSVIADYFVLCSGNSTTQVQAIAKAVKEKMGQKGITVKGMEGYDEAKWVLIDCGDVVVHVFREEEREFYNLDRIWSDAHELSIV
ncbi:ribosome silencing factor [Effusibacillus dendaii]|uniref:Ribosomal silencing factor RsfS n=1 Tax=Effusibacillus dendaii TaxID=2743772 RepID=A0A7I8DKW1_9BACL|nr:ribosome silencing factor [Effusibacillus dendaii]BCJ88561.1 ribosomal silencing factor RsfS [Effusibacillus dendaii]